MSSFRPAPSQPSMEEIISNPANIEKAAKKSNEMQRKEVRDEKIARIIKEFREKFRGEKIAIMDLNGEEYLMGKMIDAEAFLTQTLTTLLNEE
jgi:hypothetical protein